MHTSTGTGTHTTSNNRHQTNAHEQPQQHSHDNATTSRLNAHLSGLVRQALRALWSVCGATLAVTTRQPLSTQDATTVVLGRARARAQEVVYATGLAHTATQPHSHTATNTRHAIQSTRQRQETTSEGNRLRQHARCLTWVHAA